MPFDDLISLTRSPQGERCHLTSEAKAQRSDGPWSWGAAKAANLTRGSGVYGLYIYQTQPIRGAMDRAPRNKLAVGAMPHSTHVANFFFSTQGLRREIASTCWSNEILRCVVLALTCARSITYLFVGRPPASWKTVRIRRSPPWGHMNYILVPANPIHPRHHLHSSSLGDWLWGLPSRRDTIPVIT